MTITATVDNLKAIYTPTAAQTDSVLATFVSMGNLIVNEQLAGQKCVQTDARLTLISSWLAAHFASITAQQASGMGPLKSEKMGDATDQYAVPDVTKGGYMTTPYGQTALALDTCGILASSLSNGGLKAQFEVVGSSPEGWPAGYPYPYRGRGIGY